MTQKTSLITASLSDRIKTYFKNKRWQSRTLLTFLVLIFILGLARLLLPPAIIYSTTSWLKEQDIDSTIEAINISIINGTVSLVNAKGYREGTELFNIGQVDLYWRWAPLSEKTIIVTKVGLDKFNTNIKQYSNGINIGGVHIPLNKAAPDNTEEALAKPDKKIKPWAASLGEVIFTNLNVCYLQHTTTLEQSSKNSLFVDYCVTLEEMSWSGTISYATDNKLLETDDLAISSTGDFKLNGLTVTDNKLNKHVLVSSSNTLENVVISGLKNIQINKLEMNKLSALQRDDKKHVDAVRFQQLRLDDIKFTSLNQLFIDSIKVNDPGFYLVKNKPQQWEYEQWLPQATTTKVTENKKKSSSTTSAGSLKVTINNININNADSCYLESSSALYYCLTFESFNWDGAINVGTQPSEGKNITLAINGNLNLTQPELMNNNINQSLLNFGELALTDLNITGLDAVSLKQLTLTQLKALQRGDKQNDSTVSFNQLSVSDIKYSKNNIAVNNIGLEGLSSTVSKNKNGEWEHNKWQSDNKTGKPESSSKQSPEKQDPVLLSLKKLNVTTDKEILFIDNSTQPAMKVGLQSLLIEVSDLDSTLPDTNSPIKLVAQTLRHSTIDVNGTAKPFAEKVSFKIDGKLKGFDMRAASPATQKSIGHIIKSGQLDADLKLLAVDDQLDSNISLSLYQFHIKPKSKQDAEKLDGKLGMPLNQTLVLLRDKDDSIHLDIPITGDINNPDFDPMDAIIKATTKAATVTLITFYTPYGLIYAGGNVLFDLATAMNFDPLIFDAGTAELSDGNKEQLEGLAKLLSEKPQIRLTLCGMTDKDDFNALNPDLKKQNDKDGEAPKPSKEQSTALTKLANDRQVNSKNYLIKQARIDHERLILCAPEHKDKEGEISGVEINI